MRLACVALLLGACARKDAAPAVDSTTAAAAPAGPVLLSSTTGFSTPESVLWDGEQGVWYVSNINGDPGAKDNNGFISRLGRDGVIDSLRFIQGGRGGATLNGPCGMLLVDDTLWVADGDAVRGFNRRTGAPIATVEFGTQARFLNDLALGPDGVIYVTDTGIQFTAGEWKHPGPDRIYSIAGRKVAVALDGPWLNGPNGIAWDADGARFLLVTDSNTVGWTPGQTSLDTIGRGIGGYDGIALLNGRVLISSWTDSTINLVRDGATTRVLTNQESPADIGADPARNLLAIPSFLGNKVNFWTLP
jgi:hypothetical protein